MKFAAIADVHGNCAALQAVLADIAAQGITEVVNLGDHVSGPLEPSRTADMLMERGFPSIRGNQDRMLVEKRAQLGRAFAWLDDSYLEWLAAMPATLLYRDAVLLCHGTPHDDETYWLDRVTSDGIIAPAPIEDVEAEARAVSASLILCGHTHIPRVVRLRDGRLVVNAGSVGLPGYRGTDPVAHTVSGHAACLLRHPGAHAKPLSATMRYVTYDNMRMAELAAANGNPCGQALATGWVR
jgi:predicted phosphodiesterase